MPNRPVTILLCLLAVAAASNAAAPAPSKPLDLGALDALSGIDPSDPSSVADALAGQLPPRALAALEQGLERQRSASAAADGLAGASGIADLLAQAAAQAGIAPADGPEPTGFASFAEAVPALGATAGVASTPEGLASAADLDRLLPPELARPILDLMGAMVSAAAMRAEAFAALTPEDHAVLADQLAALMAGESPDTEALDRVAAKIGFPRLVFAADLVARASEDAAREIEENVGLWPEPESVPTGPAPPVRPLPIGTVPMAPYLGPPCDPPYTFPLLVSIPSILSLGSFAPNTFSDDVILSIDPGPGGPPGDCYTNNAGATNFVAGYPTLGGGGPFFPVAAAIDLAGDDVYHSSNDPISDAAVLYPAPAPPDSVQADAFIQGAAMLGIGLLLDVGGDDRYASDMELDPCPFGASAGDVGYTFQFLQGAAFVGIGLMADLEGQDHYNSYNTLHNCDTPTGPGDDVDYTVRFAQGAGALGIGVLLDAGTPDSDADDAYNSENSLFADGMDVWPIGLGNARYLVDHTQGAGAFLGVGVMVETNEDVLYNSLNDLLATPNPFTLDFAPQSSADFDVHCSQGIVGACHTELPELCIDPIDSDLIDNQDICVPPVKLRALTPSNVVGILVDALGHDKYNCGNTAIGTLDWATGIPSSYTAWVVQGVVAGTATPLGPIDPMALLTDPIAIAAPSVDVGVGVHVDAEGDDCYNSSNVVEGFEATLDIRLAQGTGQGVAAVGVLADRARDDRYNCDNALYARRGTDILIEYVQGHGAGTLAVGVHVDTTTPQGQSADCYNSFNDQFSGEADDLTIHFSQGTAGGSLQVVLPPAVFATPPIGIPTAIGVLVDTDSPYQDPMPSRDFFNSYNAAGGLGELDIWVAQGAVSNAPVPGTPVLPGGAGIMVEVGSNNTYNYENAAYGLGGCPPFVGGGCQLDVALGSVTNLLDVGAFVDVSLQPCSIFTITAALLGINPAPVCFDTIGPDRYGGPLSATVVTYPAAPDTVGCYSPFTGGLAVSLDLYDGWGAWAGPPLLPTNPLPGAPYPDPAPWPGFAILGPPTDGLLCIDE